MFLDGDGADLSQFKEGVAKVTSKISSVASNVIETFQVRELHGRREVGKRGGGREGGGERRWLEWGGRRE